MPSALIADDENVLAEFLKTELAELWPELKVIGIPNNGVDALRMIDELAPTIAFLDIRMPGRSGLEVAQRLLGEESAPLIVFVTAYDQYAVDAFEREAVDYLLKPPTRERLQRTVDKLKRQVSEVAPVTHAQDDLIARLAIAFGQAPSVKRLDWIRAAHGNETRLIAIDEVIYFEANDKYVSVFTQDGESLIRTPLKELQEGLDEKQFWQIHRGTVVAVKHIAGLKRDFRGRTLLGLKNRSEELVVSRAYLHLFKQM
jgi:DNA-binding LytR/AlgR family response regulator